jgi:hypothetical protein
MEETRKNRHEYYLANREKYMERNRRREIEKADEIREYRRKYARVRKLVKKGYTNVPTPVLGKASACKDKLTPSAKPREFTKQDEPKLITANTKPVINNAPLINLRPGIIIDWNA